MATWCLCQEVFLPTPTGSTKDNLISGPDFLLLNVQSLNLEKINNIEIEYLSNSNIKFVCLTETWAKQDTINHLNFNNFYLSSNFCRENAKGGGVAIWINKEIESRILDVDRFCVEKSIELCAVCVRLCNISVIVLTCYRSPSADLNVFFYNIDNALNYLYKPNVSFVLCGDINIDGYISENCQNKKFSTLCNTMLSFNLLPMVKWPTRVTDDTITTIDHIFTNINDSKNCIVLDNTLSDHRVVFFQSNLFSDKRPHLLVSNRRFFSDRAVSRFCGELYAQDWRALYGIDRIDEAFDLFFNVFLGHFENHFPITKSYNHDNGKNWITPEVKKSSSALRDLFVLSREHPSLSESYKVAKKPIIN